MAKTVLITGGAGFIGSHTADELLAAGYAVRALDNLSVQVHGPEQRRPVYLDPRVELVVGDVRSESDVRRALAGVHGVIHLAAAVGVGQSMYQMAHYTSTNDLGTAVLLEALADSRVERLVVASSMSIYGEGRYLSRDGDAMDEADRRVEDLRAGRFEPRGPDGEALDPTATPEGKRPCLSSVYALSKYQQEQLALITGRATGRATVALRFFNVYGPRQALNNPYTGVMAIFASRLLNGRRPEVFEDGHQRRDFVHVADVARAIRLALERDGVGGQAYNIGSGRSLSVLDVAARLARALGREDLTPRITGRHRVGDIRHCFADITRAREELGFTPTHTLEDGIQPLVAWLASQTAVDRTDQAAAELEARGLTL